MNKFKVFFIAGWYPSEKDPTSGVFVKEHAKAASLNDDIVVVSSEGVEERLQSLYKIEDQLEYGLRTLRVKYQKSPVPKTTYPLYLWSIFKSYKHLVNEGFEPDIIHANVFTTGVPAVLLGKIFDLPVVITEHYTGFPRKTLSGFNKLKAKFAMNQADLLLPVSKYLRDCIKDYGIENDFHVVPNVVDTDLFYPHSNIRGAKNKQILLVALLSSQKGVPYLLKAVTKLSKTRKDFTLEIVGDGPKKAQYERQVSELGIKNIVTFHGMKSKEKVAEFMRESHLFVLPSIFETFGVVLIEAMASGLPVVTTDIGGPNELVTQEVGELVPSKDSEALARTLDDVLDNLESYSPKRIRRYARDNFSLNSVGKELHKVYREISVEKH